MGFFWNRRQDAPVSECIRGNLLFCDFTSQERQKQFDRAVSGFVADPERAIFEWIILDTAVVSQTIDQWMVTTAPEFREQIISSIWSHCVTFLIESFPRFINATCYREVLDPKIGFWQDYLVRDLSHRNGPGWVIGKAYADIIDEAENLPVVLFASQIMVKVSHLRKTFKDMKKYRVVAG